MFKCLRSFHRISFLIIVVYCSISNLGIAFDCEKLDGTYTFKSIKGEFPESDLPSDYWNDLMVKVEQTECSFIKINLYKTKEPNDASEVLELFLDGQLRNVSEGNGGSRISSEVSYWYSPLVAVLQSTETNYYDSGSFLSQFKNFIYVGRESNNVDYDINQFVLRHTEIVDGCYQDLDSGYCKEGGPYKNKTTFDYSLVFEQKSL